MAIHEVYVRRISVIEEDLRIPIDIDPDDPDLDELLRRGIPLNFAHLKIIKRRGIAFATQLISSGRWSEVAQRRVLVAGEPEMIDRTMNVVTDEEIAEYVARETGGPEAS